MKISSVLGLASLAANVALIGVIASGAFRDQPVAAPAPVVVSSAPTPSAASAVAPAEAWQELNAADLAAQRDRLKAEGFPPSVIRSILAAQIREQFAARRKAIEATTANQPYWKNSIPDAQSQAQLRALYKDEQKALKDLLGPDPTNSRAARLTREFPDLASDKVELVAGIQERLDEQRQEIYGNFRGGSLTPSEREKITLLEKTASNEIKSVLAPQEFENYDLRTSNTANQLRYTLADFGATEAEFRALYQLQSVFDDQYRSMGSMSQDQQRARMDAQKKLNDDIAAALGPQRYADYQRASDYNYRQTSQLVSRLNLPPETATSLYAVQKDVEERRNAIYRDTSPETRSQMPEKFTALATEATGRIASILGGNKTATDAYQKYGGSWLANLVPRPTPPGSGGTTTITTTRTTIVTPEPKK